MPFENPISETLTIMIDIVFGIIILHLPASIIACLLGCCENCEERGFVCCICPPDEETLKRYIQEDLEKPKYYCYDLSFICKAPQICEAKLLVVFISCDILCVVEIVLLILLEI